MEVAFWCVMLWGLISLTIVLMNLIDHTKG